MVKVYLEKNGKAELIAVFADEDAYNLCIDVLAKHAESKGMLLTESVEESAYIENVS